MKPRLVLLVFLALVLAACSDESTLIAGDDATEALEEDAMEAEESASVADASAPFEITTTTAPASLEQEFAQAPRTTIGWEETLQHYPLLTQLAEPPGSGTGRAMFVLVDEDDQPIFSGDEDAPQFVVRISSWFGVDNYIEYTMSAANAQLVGGDVYLNDCGNFTAWLEQIGDATFVRRNGQLPAIEGSSLAWEDDGCPPRPALDTLFQGEIAIDVTETGLVVTDPNGERDPAIFRRLNPPASAPTTTIVDLPATTIFVDTTTTTTAAPSEQ